MGEQVLLYRIVGRTDRAEPIRQAAAVDPTREEPPETLSSRTSADWMLSKVSRPLPPRFALLPHCKAATFLRAFHSNSIALSPNESSSPSSMLGAEPDPDRLSGVNTSVRADE